MGAPATPKRGRPAETLADTGGTPSPPPCCSCGDPPRAMATPRGRMFMGTCRTGTLSCPEYSSKSGCLDRYDCTFMRRGAALPAIRRFSRLFHSATRSRSRGTGALPAPVGGRPRAPPLGIAAAAAAACCRARRPRPPVLPALSARLLLESVPKSEGETTPPAPAPAISPRGTPMTSSLELIGEPASAPTCIGASAAMATLAQGGAIIATAPPAGGAAVLLPPPTGPPAAPIGEIARPASSAGRTGGGGAPAATTAAALSGWGDSGGRAARVRCATMEGGGCRRRGGKRGEGDNAAEISRPTHGRSTHRMRQPPRACGGAGGAVSTGQAEASP